MDEDRKPSADPQLGAGVFIGTRGKSDGTSGDRPRIKPVIAIDLLYKPRIVLGLSFLLLGVLLILRNFGVIEIESFWHFWPLILVAMGVSGILQPRESHGRGLGWTLLLVGVWLQLSYFGLLPFRVRDLWPLIFIFLGGNLIWHGIPRAVSVSTGADTLSSFAIGGGVEWKTSSQAFRGGDASAILGGCDIDLRQAQIEGDEASIEVLAFWGGIEMKVPEDWNVVVRGTPVLGAFTNRTHTPKEGTRKTLIINGVAIMGGVEIKN